MIYTNWAVEGRYLDELEIPDTRQPQYSKGHGDTYATDDRATSYSNPQANS